MHLITTEIGTPLSTQNPPTARNHYPNTKTEDLTPPNTIFFKHHTVTIGTIFARDM